MSWAPDDLANRVEGARDIAAPTDLIVSRIFAYWNRKRGQRRMPSRADIDPVELRALVEHITLYDVVEPGKLYRVRLVGGAIVDFVGRNATGKFAHESLAPDVAAQMIEVLTSVVVKRAPRFRAGTAYWRVDKSYRRFEAGFMPLSPDDDRVDKIIAGIVFDRSR